MKLAGAVVGGKSASGHFEGWNVVGAGGEFGGGCGAAIGDDGLVGEIEELVGNEARLGAAGWLWSGERGRLFIGDVFAPVVWGCGGLRFFEYGLQLLRQ